MLVQIIDDNGTKKIVPLTADAGAGNPVGTVIVVCSNQIPSNYLQLGTQYDTSLYPVLYALLGTDTTPTASALGLPTLSSGQYAIKATSGLTENQQENVLNTINENLSYSTTEHKTGKKSIDGKDVYSKSFVYSGATTAMTGISMGSIGSFEDVETINGSLKFSTGSVISLGYMNNDNNKVFEVSIDTSGNVSAISPYSDSNSKIKITLEYIKTTDN